MQITKETVKEAVRQARTQAPYRDDTRFTELLKAQIGSPVLARSPEGTPAFWLAPLTAQGWACGFAMVDLQGRVTSLGIFGGTARDRTAWVKAGFFKAPPADALVEITSRYPGAALSRPVFSYDNSPARWAWRLTASPPGGQPVTLFITPGGWYPRPDSPVPQDFEG